MTTLSTSSPRSTATEVKAGKVLPHIESLPALFRFLDQLKERAGVEELDVILRTIQVTFDDVREFAHFDPHHYKRNLIRAGEWYHVLALCWSSGQRSPIHDHAHSTCGVRVLKGKATETVFERSPCGQIVATTSRVMQAPQITVTADSDIHQISNLEPAGSDLVTLHIYSPPLLEMSTYSLTSARVERYRDDCPQHCDGSGI